MRKWLRCAWAIAVCFAIAGCWDIKSIQDVNYFTAIGIDYENGRYQVYVQQLDFSSVAKSETGKSDRPANIWVGKASGETTTEAIIELYQTTQQTVFWGHLNAIVLSKKALKQGGLLGVIDSIIRFPEFRYTPWVFGTEVELRKLFSTRPFFNLSPMNSILQAPEKNYEQRPMVAPMRLSRFVREIREPGLTTLLPSLAVTSHTWTENLKPDSQLELNGVYAMRNTRYLKWMPAGKLLGTRWVVNRSQGARVMLKDRGERVAALQLSKPKSKIRVSLHNGEPTFRVEVEAAATILELWKGNTEAELETMAAEEVTRQIKTSHLMGQKANADVLGLEHHLYRFHYPVWKRLTSNGSSPLANPVLGEIKTTVRIAHSGMYKLKRSVPES
ncbi:Ger(x)C family spore germination protein [Cohnella hongkongensis]|uniref:Ger(X)C family spore germination protein n=1 Tax=Cohnella hongkongensis TaxID=178337 RepID=A0ABV9F9P2_9BACL